MKKSEHAKTAKKADHLKTKEERMEELLYLGAEKAVLKNSMPESKRKKRGRAKRIVSG